MRFPRFDEQGPLTTTELEALRSLNAAFLTARYEWQSAVALWDRLQSHGAVAEQHETPTTFPFHGQALQEIANGATAYERHAALTAWRYTAAALVLGVAVLQRVAEAKQPLSTTTVEELCQEPTLGRLHEALSVPVADLLPERQLGIPNDRERTAQRWAKVRDGVDDAIERVVEIAEDEEEADPRTKDEAAGCLLTQHCPPHTDPVYQGVLEPLFRLAEEVSFDINRLIEKG
ncbi:hypothetical protein OG897_39880 [Streptomyces sp. NBC_00237]|uniref:hypothetical protein n=1 Tax=Streptomyces sp. NBC_00237 TaxID=2975687 RepID=UPI0022591C41|nr:hypothetical protein [Streptomyces sp. NBC_00237]MCX5207552.1 hypothetical protein [Streptomyces sp. NBC_00237]